MIGLLTSNLIEIFELTFPINKLTGGLYWGMSSLLTQKHI
jgi:hypothetical protein